MTHLVCDILGRVVLVSGEQRGVGDDGGLVEHQRLRRSDAKRVVVDGRDAHAERAVEQLRDEGGGGGQVQRHPQQVVGRVAVVVHVMKTARILVGPRDGVPQGEVPPLQRQNSVAGQGAYGGQQLASARAHALGAEHLQELLQG